MIKYHITFENGSNPYFSFDQSEKEFFKDLRKWNKHYNLIQISKISAPGGSVIYMYLAIDK